MKPARVLRYTLALAAIAPVVASPRVQVAAAPMSHDLQAYVATPSHQAETVKAAQSSGRWLAVGCSHAQPFGASQITYANSLVSFAPNGAPQSGIWMERVIASGCGPDVRLNVAWIVVDGRMSGGAMAPGNIRADPELQTDVARIVRPVVQAKVPPCAGAPGYIYDTSVDPAAPGAVLGSWAERWKIASCNRYVTVSISFTPDGKGGTVFAVKANTATVE